MLKGVSFFEESVHVNLARRIIMIPITFFVFRFTVFARDFIDLLELQNNIYTTV